MARRRINAICSRYPWDRPLGFSHLPLCMCSVTPIWILTIALWAVHQRCSLLGTFDSSHPLLIAAAVAIVVCFLRQELLAIEMTIGTIRTSLGNIEKSPSDLQTYIQHVSVSLIKSGPRRVHLTHIVQKTYRYLKAKRQDHYLCQLEQKHQDFL